MSETDARTSAQLMADTVAAFTRDCPPTEDTISLFTDGSNEVFSVVSPLQG
jgi:hypothetical protein